MTERKQFEHALIESAEIKTADVLDIYREEYLEWDGSDYKNESVNLMWWTWQARGAYDQKEIGHQQEL